MTRWLFSLGGVRRELVAPTADKAKKVIREYGGEVIVDTETKQIARRRNSQFEPAGNVDEAQLDRLRVNRRQGLA